MLRIEHLNKSFGNTEVLKDLNLEVKEKTVYGLVGVNGAGKSTLLRLIAGVYQRDSGTILFNDKDPQKDAEIRKEIAFVPDEAYFPAGATIASLKELYQCMYGFDEEAFRKYLEVFELNEKSSVGSLSKGNKRRVSILFALCTHPKLLLLDEAYDGLEPLARLKFRQILAELLEDENITVIISSHNLRELEDICDSYGILEDGKMLDHGDLERAKESVWKYQIAFSEDKGEKDFEGLQILHYEQSGRVITMVIQGEKDAVSERLQAMKPVLLDVLPVSFEELYIYRLEGERREDHA